MLLLCHPRRTGSWFLIHGTHTFHGYFFSPLRTSLSHPLILIAGSEPLVRHLCAGRWNFCTCLHRGGGHWGFLPTSDHGITANVQVVIWFWQCCMLFTAFVHTTFSSRSFVILALLAYFYLHSFVLYSNFALSYTAIKQRQLMPICKLCSLSYL